MTDITAAAPVKGRSLWADAWGRMKANRAAVVSAVYLFMMALACTVGPWLTPHAFNTIYPDYVRIAPSLEPYPRDEMIEQAVKDVVSRTRAVLQSWEEADGRVRMTITSAKPLDERLVRYIDR